MKFFMPALTLAILVCAALLCFGHGDQEVAEDQKMVASTGYWIYNDLEEGIAQAEKTAQPMLIVFR